MNAILGTTLHVPVTLLYGALVAILIGGLGVHVSRLRGKKGIYIGDAPDQELERAIRAHGNATEYAPFQLVLLLALELSGTGSIALHLIGGTIVLARVMHAVGVLAKSRVQAVGAGLSYLLCFGLAAYALVVDFR